mmetsp:Transcript_14744/g.35987  ORF Transcript_14744/g.35987 Transcript_14744/m.35987 type:complete len:472 (+) Transcript_14744:640-2055(+)
MTIFAEFNLAATALPEPFLAPLSVVLVGAEALKVRLEVMIRVPVATIPLMLEPDMPWFAHEHPRPVHIVPEAFRARRLTSTIIVLFSMPMFGFPLAMATVVTDIISIIVLGCGRVHPLPFALRPFLRLILFDLSPGFRLSHLESRLVLLLRPSIFSLIPLHVFPRHPVIRLTPLVRELLPPSSHPLRDLREDLRSAFGGERIVLLLRVPFCLGDRRTMAASTTASGLSLFCIVIVVVVVEPLVASVEGLFIGLVLRVKRAAVEVLAMLQAVRLLVIRRLMMMTRTGRLLLMTWIIMLRRMMTVAVQPLIHINIVLIKIAFVNVVHIDVLVVLSGLRSFNIFAVVVILLVVIIVAGGVPPTVPPNRIQSHGTDELPIVLLGLSLLSLAEFLLDLLGDDRPHVPREIHVREPRSDHLALLHLRLGYEDRVVFVKLHNPLVVRQVAVISRGFLFLAVANKIGLLAINIRLLLFR